MNIEIVSRPGASAAKITLAPEETLTSEAGSMIAVNNGVSITTTTRKKSSGGIFKAAKRLLAGESFFLNHYTGLREGGEVFLASNLPGDMTVLDLKGQNFVVQSGSFVACAETVDIDLGWQGFKSILSGESVFWLKLNGAGQTIVSAFGAIYSMDVDGEYIVDSGHIVAFEESLDFTITKAGSSWLHSIMGGEGLVCKFHGRGRVWMQSHNPSAFGKYLGPKLKPR